MDESATVMWTNPNGVPFNSLSTIDFPSILQSSSCHELSLIWLFEHTHKIATKLSVMIKVYCLCVWPRWSQTHWSCESDKFEIITGIFVYKPICHYFLRNIVKTLAFL